MHSHLKFFNFESDTPSDCGKVLEIDISNHNIDWPGIILEKGSSPHFYPNNVYTPYFYFALALEQDLHWKAGTTEAMATIKTSPGEIWINPPGTPFSHEISEPCYFLILAIEEDIFLQNCPLNLSKDSLKFLNNYNVDDVTLKGIIDLFLMEVQNGGRNGYPYIKNLLSLLSTHYINNYSNHSDLQSTQTDTSKFSQNEMDKLDKYIDMHISNNISINDLADVIGCSKYYFLREFKKLNGFTPYQYLLTKRLERAKVLLSQPESNITLISLELGFNDQSHFTRVFKKHFGVTPGRFLKTLSFDE